MDIGGSFNLKDGFWVLRDLGNGLAHIWHEGGPAVEFFTPLDDLRKALQRPHVHGAGPSGFGTGPNYAFADFTDDGNLIIEIGPDESEQDVCLEMITLINASGERFSLALNRQQLVVLKDTLGQYLSRRFKAEHAVLGH